jgi:hypothetical protein
MRVSRALALAAREADIISSHRSRQGVAARNAYGQLSLDATNENSHGRAERRSLAYHRVLARRLKRPMVDDALRLLWKWREQGRIDERYADQWEQVLREPIPDVRSIISEDTQRGRDLRQNSPFAGMLSEAERRRINEEIQLNGP